LNARPRACASSSIAAVVTMADSGRPAPRVLDKVRMSRAVTVLTRTAVPDDLQVLSPAHGLPELPGVGLTLAFDREAPGAPAAAFATHIRQLLPPA
jgi:hypothetical protein